MNDAQPGPEFVRSAIRSAQHIGATVVWTSHDRWLLLTGYEPQYRAWAARGVEGIGDGPRVDACTILRGATKAEFYGACNTMDPVPYRSDLTPAGEQLVIPGCERNASPKAKQLDLF